MSKISAYQLTDIDFIALSKTESNPRTRVRLLMLAQMAKGVSPQQVAEQFGFNPITIRKLRRTFQTQGINGLYDREGRGRHSPLSIEQKEQLKTEIVALQQQRGGGRVTAVNIAELIQQKFNVVYNPNSLYKLLKQIGMSWVSGRSAHPEKNDAAQAEFKKIASKLKEILPASADLAKVDLWFQDESRVGQQGSISRVWHYRGERPRLVRQQQFEYSYIYGAICPARGVCCGLVLPRANIEGMRLHLQEISAQVPEGHHSCCDR
jgi:transposase